MKIKKLNPITLRNAIDEGIKSGIAKNFNPKNHLKQLKSKIK